MRRKQGKTSGRVMRALMHIVPLSLSIAILSSALFSQIAVRGILIDRETNKPVAGATVGVFETKEITVSDEGGRFNLKLGEGRRYTLYVSMPGYKRKKVVIDAGKEIPLIKIYLSEQIISADEIVVRARKDKPRVSRRTVRREEIKRVAGTSGDIMRSLQSLPGVATGSDVSGLLFVRGNGPYDNRILFDLFLLDAAYHFGGFVSVINSDLIDTIDFYTGGFPVMYGEAVGSVLDIKSRGKEEPTWGGKINVNLLTADAVIEAPFTENGYILLSGRRSYFDLYAESFIKDVEEVDVSILPYFWDYQAKLGYFFTKRNNIELLFFGSGDRIGLTFGEDEDVDFAGRKFDYDLISHGQGFTWRYVPSDSLFSTLKIGLYEAQSRMILGEYVDMDPRVAALFTREDVTLNLSRLFSIDLGVEYIYAQLNIDGRVPVLREDAPDNPIFPDDYTIEDFILHDLDYHHYSSYLQNTLTISPIKWVLGVRFDLHKDVKAFHYLSPRTSLECAIDKQNRLSLAVGLYQQAQDLYFTNREFGNPDLDTQKAIHYVLGYERDLTPKTTISIEGYYKNLWDLIVTGGDGETFNDTGTGRAYGGELLIRRRLADGFFGWFSYGYSVSKRDDHDVKGEYFFDYDRTHIINIIASYRVVDWFQVGFKWRYATGLPYTSIVGSQYIPSKDEYFPVYSADFNRDRMPDYHKLDIRIDFFAHWFGVEWDIYIEVLNAYNSRNIYDRDFDQREPYSSDNPMDVRDLPLLPYFGVEVKF
jgi:hypothetical protein